MFYILLVTVSTIVLGSLLFYVVNSFIRFTTNIDTITKPHYRYMHNKWHRMY